MKYFVLAFLLSVSLSSWSYANESVAYITHQVVTDADGKVMSFKKVKSHLVIPEDSSITIKEHHANVAKAETLIDWDTVFSLGKKAGVAAIGVAKAVASTNKAIDKYAGSNPISPPKGTKDKGQVAKESKN